MPAPTHYALDGVTIAIEAETQWLSDLVTPGLEALATGPAPADIRVRVQTRPPPAETPSSGATLAIEKSWIRLPAYTAHLGPDRLRIALGDKAVVIVDYAAGLLSVHVLDPDYWAETRHPLYTSSVLFKSALLELLPQFGLVPLHAAMTSVEGAGVLIAGGPGHGKTALLLDLLSQGARYMADELGMVRLTAEGPQLVAFPIGGKLHGSPDAPPTGLQGAVHADGAWIFDPVPIAGWTRQAPARLLVDIGPPGAEAGFAPLDAFDLSLALGEYAVFYNPARHEAALLAAIGALADRMHGLSVTPSPKDTWRQATITQCRHVLACEPAL